MVDDGYLAHASADGASFSARILRSGYVGRHADWILGENLALGERMISPRPPTS